MRSCSIHLKAISQDDIYPWYEFENYYLTLQLLFLGDNELSRLNVKEGNGVLILHMDTIVADVDQGPFSVSHSE